MQCLSPVSLVLHQSSLSRYRVFPLNSSRPLVQTHTPSKPSLPSPLPACLFSLPPSQRAFSPSPELLLNLGTGRGSSPTRLRSLCCVCLLSFFPRTHSGLLTRVAGHCAKLSTPYGHSAFLRRLEESRPGNLAAIAQLVHGRAGPAVLSLTPVPSSPWQHCLPGCGSCKDRACPLWMQ